MVADPSGQLSGCCGAHAGDGICQDGTAASGLTRCCGHANGTCNAFCCACTHGCKHFEDYTVEPEWEVIDGSLLDLPLNEFPMILAHDAGTGYENNNFCNNFNPIGNYAVCQRGNFTEQLNCGARAFDIRPYKKSDGSMCMHHGGTVFDVLLQDALEEVLDWLESHPDELVILFVQFVSGDTQALINEAVIESNELVKEMGFVRMSMKASFMRDMTVRTALEKGRIGTGGAGFFVYELGDDGYDPSLTCFSGWGESCIGTQAQRQGRYTAMHEYLGGQFNGDQFPLAGGLLWNTQAHWQYDAASIAAGLSRFSCILAEEASANVNALLASGIANGDYSKMNLVQMDYVCDSGKDAFKAMRSFARAYADEKSSLQQKYEMPHDAWRARPCYARGVAILAAGAVAVSTVVVGMRLAFGRFLSLGTCRGEAQRAPPEDKAALLERHGSQ
mmetsp:Transcript_107431/g.300159  ORF Transcript_107431/g.300159 Transcript_107431/m.300159 type:complete len:446 (-) Transcript_107431:138-1475(-)